ncbi:MAG: TolC family protein [Gammaproteobacteria bacterium]|nr:TolC family protein [Gammaproteobacteria bacterium]
MSKKKSLRCFFALFLLFSFQCSYGEETLKTTELPEPLPLDFALSLAQDEKHVSLQKNQAKIDEQLALDKQLQSSRNLQLGLKANAWLVEPSNALAQSIDNRKTPHLISLYGSKLIYDFGRLSIDEEVQQYHLDVVDLKKTIIKRENYLKILNDFFDVLLADLKHAYHNEALAMAYIRYDRGKTYYEQKKISELDLMDLENKNMIASDDFFESGQEQRLTRSKLSQSINKAGTLPDKLIFPDWKKHPQLSLNRKLPTFEKLLTNALNNNKQINLLKQELKVLELNVERSKLDNSPSLTGLFSGNWYARELSGGDQLKLGIQLDIPLYDGGKFQSRKTIALSKVHDMQAELRAIEMQVEQELLSTTQLINTLKRRDKRLSQMVSLSEQILDKNRIDYDLEFKSDLGNSMVNLSFSQMQYHQNRFDLAYQWAVLDSLTGNY